MFNYIIFDLSEVLIAGLVGIERQLVNHLSIPEGEILKHFWNEKMFHLCMDQISEDAFIEHVLAETKWPLTAKIVKLAIRHNFANEIPGTLNIVRRLANETRLILLSDHSREWISHIKTIHHFFSLFEKTFFSFELKSMKSDPQTFLKVLKHLDTDSQNCLFIDDSVDNVAVATSVGIKSIQFVSAAQLTAVLEECGYVF